MLFLRSIVVLLTLFMSNPAMAKDNDPVDVLPSSSSYLRSSVSSMSKFATGLVAIRGHQKHVTNELAIRLVNEATDVLSKPENKWMPIHIFLGLAINESDLQWWLAAGLDCGLCQNNMSRFRISYHAKIRLCKKIRKNSKLSMEYAMQELNQVRAKWCTDAKISRMNRYYRGTRKVTQLNRWRCILNVYNQGPRYMASLYHTCRFSWSGPEDGTIASVEKNKRRCTMRNRYWVRTMCFAEGVKLGKKPMKMVYRRGRYIRKKASCRYARTMKWVRKIYQ